MPPATPKPQQQSQCHRRDDPDGAGQRGDGSGALAGAEPPVHHLSARRVRRANAGGPSDCCEGVLMLVRRPSGAVLVGLTLACLAMIPAHAAADTVLRTRLNADIRSTDPGTNRDANTDGVVAHMVEGLVAFRDDTSIGPMLAESWDISEDGKTYTFKLRRGVKFHNGATMTSDDVVWSFKRWLDPATQWRCLTELNGKGFAKIEAVEAPDPGTVVIKLDQPTALFLGTIARPDCGQTAIIHKDSLSP